MLEHIPPQSLEAEQATLGAMLMERDALARVVDVLEPEDFYSPQHQMLYRAMVDMFNDSEPVDLVTVQTRLQNRGQLEEGGRTTYLLALQESARAKTAAAAAMFARGAVEAEARRLMASSGGSQQNVGAEVAKAADTLENILHEMRSNRLGTETQREHIRTGVVKPLKDLAGPIRKVVGSIHATKSVAAAAELKGQADAIEDIQRDVFKQMNDILTRMTKLESKQELANKLQIIIKWSEQLFDSIRKRRDAEVGTVFESTTQPAGRK